MAEQKAQHSTMVQEWRDPLESRPHMAGTHTIASLLLDGDAHLLT